MKNGQVCPHMWTHTCVYTWTHTDTRDKIFEQKFLQEHTQMVNKHTKTSSLYTIILANWIEPIITSAGKQKMEPLHCGGAVKWFSYMVVPWLNMELSLQPAIPLSGNVHKRGWIRAQTKAQLSGISTSVSPESQGWKHLKCSSANEWINKNAVYWHKRITTSQATWCVTAWINPDNEAFMEEANHRDHISFGSIY